jgi:hypothetical protein
MIIEDVTTYSSYCLITIRPKHYRRSYTITYLKSLIELRLYDFIDGKSELRTGRRNKK